jgi:hypothetical protein
VASDYDCARLGNFVGTATKDFLQDPAIQVGRKGYEIDGEQHVTAHGVYIGHGVGRSDGPEVIRIVHHGREKIGRRHDGLCLAYAVYGSIICPIQSYQEIGMVLRFEEFTEWLQHVRQFGRAELRSSTCARGKCRQPDQLSIHKIGVRCALQIR